MPYVSQYTDCTDANACSGCTRCTCNDAGEWDCQDVFECPQEDGISLVDDNVLENAVEVLYTGLENRGDKKGPGSLVPAPPNPDDDLLLVPDKRIDIEEQLRELMGRHKREINGKSNNETVKFYDTIDEINEDTLKNLNASGTIEAKKIHAYNVGKASHGTDPMDGNNAPNTSDLHIEYSHPHKLEQHIAENKIDSKHLSEDKINGLSHEEIHKLLGNYSQIIKDKELSKIVVNELSRGSERIGDKNVVPVSNITFTPENDTLMAMTFIAGNLLNQLWDMEKDASEGSFETELMKHEKINDLLELFKEPLSLRQESFLKNALQKLSLVIDANKDTRNMSLCANIDNPETIEPESYNCTDKPKEDVHHSRIDKSDGFKEAHFKNKTKVTTNAINRINEVLNLIKKYEHLQEKLKNLKSFPESVYKSTPTVEENKSMDDTVSLNLFGNILQKVTKLLSPNNNSKKLTKKIGTYNMLRKDDILKKNIGKVFNIDLTNASMNVKDKMISDYLRNVEQHPNCFFNHLQKAAAIPFSNIEGNILYNLSEFFKIKSLTDLLKIVNDKPDVKNLPSTTPTTTKGYRTSTEQSTSHTLLRSAAKIKSGNLDLMKEKLKSDIRTILQDLLELQKEHGIKSTNNVNIADALPCIYKILKADNDTLNNNVSNKMSTNSINKIISFIDSLKADMKVMSNRRSNINITPRPKSAVVWERAIKTLNQKNEKASRRFLGEKPKTYKELKDMMDNVEKSAKTYKNFAIHSGVAPSERLILLKTLQADNKQYIDVLQTIQKSLKTIRDLPTEQQNEFNEFVDNAIMNINLNKKLQDLVVEFKGNASKIANSKPKARMTAEPKQPLIMIPKWIDSNENNNIKLKRDQIINQLIMNRLKLYIKSKERTEVDLNANANYNIAKRILFHLENGNIALARELYKVFLANKQHSTDQIPEYENKDIFPNNKKEESKGPRLLAFKEPLIRVEDPRPQKVLNQEYFLKQLWNLKELKK